jgi:hypothetical protein
MPVDPAAALRAASPPAAPRRDGGGLLVAGAVGRLGEALLNEALARGGHDEVVALADGAPAMALGVRGLRLATLDALPPLEAACVVPTADPDAPGARSFHGRDVPFAMVAPQELPRIAEAACAAGARRLVLVHPLPAWQQVSRFNLGLIGEAELALARLPFESVTVLRPIAQGGVAGAGWLQRIASVYLSLQFLMMPRSLPTLTSAQVARVAIDRLRAPAPGVKVLGAAQIGEAVAARC